MQGFLLGIKNPTYEKYNRYAYYFTQHLVTYSRGAKKSKTTLMRGLRFLRLPGQDSNLRPIDYTDPLVTRWGGLYHHRMHCCIDGARRFGSFHNLLPLGIVSEPSITCVKAWLLIALAYAVGVPAIHLVCNIDFSIRLLF